MAEGGITLRILHSHSKLINQPKYLALKSSILETHNSENVSISWEPLWEISSANLLLLIVLEIACGLMLL